MAAESGEGTRGTKARRADPAGQAEELPTDGGQGLGRAYRTPLFQAEHSCR